MVHFSDVNCLYLTFSNWHLQFVLVHKTAYYAHNMTPIRFVNTPARMLCCLEIQFRAMMSDDMELKTSKGHGSRKWLQLLNNIK